MKLVRAFLAAAAIGLLAGCGQMSNLQPPPGQPMPVKPARAHATPTAKELIALPPQAKPDRVDELIKRSLPRRSDPFDLPPPTGGPAPVLPSDETQNQTSVTPGE